MSAQPGRNTKIAPSYKDNDTTLRSCNTTTSRASTGETKSNQEANSQQKQAAIRWRTLNNWTKCGPSWGTWRRLALSFSHTTVTETQCQHLPSPACASHCNRDGYDSLKSVVAKRQPFSHLEHRVTHKCQLRKHQQDNRCWWLIELEVFQCVLTFSSLTPNRREHRQCRIFIFNKEKSNTESILYSTV